MIYYEIAAKEGVIQAYHQLANAYQHGKGVKQEPEAAFRWILRAAELGDMQAMYRLAERYEHGDGTPSSYLLAAKWYEQAKSMGHAEARQKLDSLRGFSDE
jgi:TPR repeat protein